MEHQDWNPIIFSAKKSPPTNRNVPRAKSEDEEIGPPPTISKDHRKRILDVRVKAKMSQEKFAQALSISPKLIKEWELGKGKPNSQQMQKINQKFKF